MKIDLVAGHSIVQDVVARRMHPRFGEHSLEFGELVPVGIERRAVAVETVVQTRFSNNALY